MNGNLGRSRLDLLLFYLFFSFFCRHFFFSLAIVCRRVLLCYLFFLCIFGHVIYDFCGHGCVKTGKKSLLKLITHYNLHNQYKEPRFELKNNSQQEVQVVRLLYTDVQLTDCGGGSRAGGWVGRVILTDGIARSEFMKIGRTQFPWRLSFTLNLNNYSLRMHKHLK